MNFRRQNRSFQFKENVFAKNAQDKGQIYHELFLLKIFLQTKPQVKGMNENYLDLHFTVNKKLADKECEEIYGTSVDLFQAFNPI